MVADSAVVADRAVVVDSTVVALGLLEVQQL